MTHHVLHPDYQEAYEYHGHTAVEWVRRQNGRVVRRWFYFDSAREAADFYYEQCACTEAA